MTAYSVHPFVGREDHLEKIRQKLIQPRTANRLNIFGGDGLGKSQLLLEIAKRLVQDNQPHAGTRENNTNSWAMLFPPLVIHIQGEGFGDTDNFIYYLQIHLKERLSELDCWYDNTDLMPHELVARNLRIFNQRGNSVVFLIDDFHRILSRMTLTDVSRLNEIYPQNTHYILVTNYQSIHQLAPNLEDSSEFLVADPIELMTLSTTEARKLLEEVNNKSESNLSTKHLEIAQSLAGGHPALLIATAENLRLLFSTKKMQTDSGYFRESINQFPLEPNINTHLNKIKNAVTGFRIPIQEFLVHVATGQLNQVQNINRNKRIDTETERDLARMGIISSEHRIYPYRLDSIYVQYIIATMLHPVLKLSDQEQLIFDLFMTLNRFVRFEDIERKFDETEWFTPNQNRKSVIESAVSRLRRKITTDLPNHYAFHIENVAGVGYAMENWIRLDILLDDNFNYRTFDLSKEEFEAKLKTMD